MSLPKGFAYFGLPVVNDYAGLLAPGSIAVIDGNEGRREARKVCGINIATVFVRDMELNVRRHSLRDRKGVFCDLVIALYFDKVSSDRHGIG
jgi:hypothetical protein